MHFVQSVRTLRQIWTGFFQRGAPGERTQVQPTGPTTGGLPFERPEVEPEEATDDDVDDLISKIERELEEFGGGGPVTGAAIPPATPGQTPPPSPAPVVDPNNEDPMDINPRMARWWRPEGKLYPFRPRSGKMTLDMLGDAGRKIRAALKRTRNTGDIFMGRASGLMVKHHKRFDKAARRYAKQNSMKLGDAIRDLHEQMINRMEGKAVGPLPAPLEKIVRVMADFNQEFVTNPMVDRSKSLLKQGFLFEMPDSLVDDGVLTNEHRKELNRNIPGFSSFMRIVGRRPQDGLIHGVVRDKNTGKVFALRVRGNVFLDPKTGRQRAWEARTKYESSVSDGAGFRD